MSSEKQWINAKGEEGPCKIQPYFSIRKEKDFEGWTYGVVSFRHEICGRLIDIMFGPYTLTIAFKKYLLPPNSWIKQQ